MYLHCTIRTTRLLMEGGTPLEAMHKYAPMCKRDTLDIVKFSPSTTFTVKEICIFSQNYGMQSVGETLSIVEYKRVRIKKKNPIQKLNAIYRYAIAEAINLLKMIVMR